MVITFLGSGSAFVHSNENFQSNILIETPNDKLLFDCGTTINDSLKNVNMNASDIGGVYISHLHADHAGGVEFLAFKTFFSPCKKPKLISHIQTLMNGWKHTWSGGLEAAQNSKKKLTDYFEIVTHSSIGKFVFDDIVFNPIKTKHVFDGKWVNSYGLFFQSENNKIFITGDTQNDKDLLKHYKSADIIFHDCEFANYEGSVHAQFHELCDLPIEIKSKMWLYHYALQPNQPLSEVERDVSAMGFAGLVKRAQKFII